MSYSCETCNKPFKSRQSLWNHKKRHALARTVINGNAKGNGVPSKEILDKPKSFVELKDLSKKPRTGNSNDKRGPSKEVLHKILKPKSFDELKHLSSHDSKKSKPRLDMCFSKSDSESSDAESNGKSDSEESETDSGSETGNEYKFLPTNENDLIESFNNLYENFDDEVDTYNHLVEILDELKRLKSIDDEEYNLWNKKLHDKIGIGLEDRVKATTNYMLQNDKTQVLHVLKDVNDEAAQKIQNLISDYFEGLDVINEIYSSLPTIKNKVLRCTLEILLGEMEKKRKSVFEIFNRLDTLDKDDALESLKKDQLITDEQYKKLLLTPNDMDAYAKVIEGRGIWLLNKPWI